VLGLGEQLPRILGQREVVLALEGLGPAVGLVVTGVVGGVGEAVGDV